MNIKITSCPRWLHRLVGLRRSTTKFALFAGHPYYPEGGASDFRAFGTVDELKELYAAKADEWSRERGGYEEPWGQIVNVTTMTVLHEARLHVWSALPNAESIHPHHNHERP
jgi:hypothetical protein